MLAAKCQRFYQAGEPTVWLTMPLVRLAFFVQEIEGLKAEESLRRVNEIRIANAPGGEGGDGARILEGEWREQARRDGRMIREEVPKMTKQEYDAMLRMTGVARREWVIDDG